MNVVNSVSETQRGKQIHACRKDRSKRPPMEAAKRSHRLSKTELRVDAAQNADLHLIIADEPRHLQNEIRVTSLNQDTPNFDNCQRNPKRPKVLVDLEHYNTLKKPG